MHDLVRGRYSIPTYSLIIDNKVVSLSRGSIIELEKSKCLTALLGVMDFLILIWDTALPK